MEEDKAVAYTNPVPPAQEATAKQGAEECPVSAITVEE